MSDKNILIDGQNELDDLYLVSHIAHIENEKLLAIDHANKSKSNINISSKNLLKQIGLLGINPDEAFDSISDNEIKESYSSDQINSFSTHSRKSNEKRVTHLNEITNIDIINLPKNVSDDLEIKKIGTVISQVESSIVVQASDNSIPFDLGSIVCLCNRKIIGTISDVFGPVASPYYRINLVKLDEQLDISKGCEIYCDVAHSTIVTDELNNYSDSEGDNSSVKTRSNITINYEKTPH